MRGSGVMGLLHCRAKPRARSYGGADPGADPVVRPTTSSEDSGTRDRENSYTSKLDRPAMLRFLPLVLKNCWRNRRRTLLTIASISVSMCLLGVMIAMYHALYLSDATPEQALRVVTRNKISLTQQMPESYKNRIQQLPGVRVVMVSQWFGGTYKDPKNFFARFAADSDKIFVIFKELKIPADQRLAFERDRTGCVIGRDLANKFKIKIGDRMALVGDIFPGDYG